VLGLHQQPGSSFERGYTEEYQAAIEKSALLQILDRSRSWFMAGAIVWLYADFPWPPDGHPDDPGNPRPPAAQSMNCKGLVDAHRKPKLAYSTVKKIFEAIR
jgi:beta-glucuronidase